MTPTEYTYADIAARTGIPAGTLYVWRQRGKLPPPDRTYNNVPVWDAATIEPWIKENQRWA